MRLNSLRNCVGMGIVLAGASFSANAIPIEFIFTGVGSGSLGSTAFRDTAFTFHEFGDSVNQQSCEGSCTFIDSGSADVVLQGIGTFAFTSGTRTFDNSGNVGFSRAGVDGLDLYNVFNVGPAYNMASSIGPVPGTASLLQWNLAPVTTTGGQLIFNDGSTPGTFQAVTAAVPEPESYAMLLAGLGLLGFMARRRKNLSA